MGYHAAEGLKQENNSPRLCVNICVIECGVLYDTKTARCITRDVTIKINYGPRQPTRAHASSFR